LNPRIQARPIVSDKTEIRGNGWRAVVPTGLLVAGILAILGGLVDARLTLVRLEGKIDALREVQTSKHEDLARRVTALETVK
jgi:hypothetical protein